MMTRIIICDDHPIISEGLTVFFNSRSYFEVVAKATSLLELEEKLQQHAADILVLDVNLPDGSGADYASRIIAKYPEMKILALTNLDEVPIIQKMFSSGVSGYVLKSDSVAEIEKAVLDIVSGKIYKSHDVKMALSSFEKKISSYNTPKITKREKEVLKYLESGLTTLEIAEIMYLSTDTIASHRKNLLRKLEVNKTILLIQKAKELGIL